MQNFDIYFSGQLLADASPEQARATLGRLFGLEGDALERLFSGRPLRIKKGIDTDMAGRYRAAFREAGALVDIVPEGSPPPTPPDAGTAPPPTAKTTPTPAAGLELLPPRTGSLEDCAPVIEPREIPDISWMELDLPGSTLDETPAPPPAHIDTGGLSMSDPAGFSLEDCADPKPARPAPDTSYLSLLDEKDD